MTSAMNDTGAITGYHAHVYYDAATTRDDAAALREGIAAGGFAVHIGGWHDGPVGPHTVGMYRVEFPVAEFARLVPWLALNRRDLSVLVHPETGNDVADHSRFALWLGPALPLRLERLSGSPSD